MKPILPLILLLFFLASCSPSDEKVNKDRSDTTQVASLNRLSAFLWDLGKNDSAMKLAEQAISISDSLIISADTAKANLFIEQKAIGLLNLGKAKWHASNLNDAMKFYQNAYDLFTSAKKPDGQTDAMLNIAILHSIKHESEKAFELFENAKETSIRSGYGKGIRYAYNNLGFFFLQSGNTIDALKNMDSMLKLKDVYPNKKLDALGYTNLGNIYQGIGNYPEALKNYLLSLKVVKELKDTLKIINGYLTIGGIQLNSANYPEAHKNYKLALDLAISERDSSQICSSLSGYGSFYYYQFKFDSSLYFHKQCLQISQKIGSKEAEITALGNIANIYMAQKKYEEALLVYQRTIEIVEKYRIMRKMPLLYVNIGELFISKGDYKKALEYLYLAHQFAEKTNSLRELKTAQEHLGQVYEKMHRPDSALMYFKSSLILRDSIYSIANAKKVLRSQLDHDFSEKEHAQKLEQKLKDEVAKEEKKIQKYIIVGIGTGLILVILLSLFILRSYRIKKRSNIELLYKNKQIEAKNKEVSRQKELVDEKQKEILDSIHYAKRIQTALITSEKYIDRNLNKLSKD